jgi:cytochrome b6-f complex iron-sulfur subunit
MTTNRRSFLRTLVGGTLFAGVTSIIGMVLAYVFPPREVQSALGPRRAKVGRADEIAAGDGRLALVDDEPVWVINLPQGFAALSAWCTHKGCTIQWDREGRVFRCPCHEGLFDERGNVVSGLPLRALPRFSVGVVHGDVYVSRRSERLT